MSPAFLLTERERAQLVALADTLIASVKVDAARIHELSSKWGADPKDVEAFFARRASDLKTIEVVLSKLERFGRPEELKGLKSILGVLSTSLGSFILSGTFSPFDKQTEAQRQYALKWWASSYLTDLRKFFNNMKSVIGMSFMTVLDENKSNPNWAALRYPGPDKDALAEAKDDFIFTMQDPFKLSPDGHLFYDAVVIGSGAGGGVSAGVLAKAGKRVLVLEKSSYVLKTQLDLTEKNTYENMFENGAVLATQDSSISILAGSTFGGGTAINWAASFRTPDHVRKEWAEKYGLSFFVTKVFDDALDAICSKLEVHSNVTHNKQNQVLIDGCKALGYPIDNIPHNAPGPHECGFCSFGCARGEKRGMQETFLKDAAEAGAHFICRANVERILHKNGQAYGVIATYTSADGKQKKSFKVTAKAVVLSAGTLNSPVVLKKSGLRNPNIGKHLRLHPVCAVRGVFYDQDIAPWKGGIMTAVSRKFGNRNGTNYGAILETPSSHPGLICATAAWSSPQEFKETLLTYRNSSLIIVITRDSGSGSVEMDKEGRMIIKYPFNKFDLESLMEGVVGGIQITVAAGANEVYGPHPKMEPFKPKSRDINDPALRSFIAAVRKTGLPLHSVPIFSAHQMGTCRLGNDSGANSVLNPQGETWEVKNLFVADASTFPTPSGVNPMITTEAVSYCIAQNVVRRLDNPTTKPIAAKL